MITLSTMIMTMITMIMTTILMIIVIAATLPGREFIIFVAENNQVLSCAFTFRGPKTLSLHVITPCCFPMLKRKEKRKIYILQQSSSSSSSSTGVCLGILDTRKYIFGGSCCSVDHVVSYHVWNLVQRCNAGTVYSMQEPTSIYIADSRQQSTVYQLHISISYQLSVRSKTKVLYRLRFRHFDGCYLLLATCSRLHFSLPTFAVTND